VKQLIEQECGIKLRIRAVGQLPQAMGVYAAETDQPGRFRLRQPPLLASLYTPLRISSSGSPVTNVPGLGVIPLRFPKPDILRATDRTFHLLPTGWKLIKYFPIQT